MTIRTRKKLFTGTAELHDSFVARLRAMTSMKSEDQVQIPTFVYSYASPVLFGQAMDSEYKPISTIDFENTVKLWVKKRNKLADLFIADDKTLDSAKREREGPIEQAINYTLRRNLTPLLAAYSTGMNELFPKLNHDALVIPSDFTVFVNLIQSIFANLATAQSAETALLHITGELSNNATFQTANSIFSLIALESKGFIPVRRGHALMLSSALMKRSDVVTDAGVSINSTPLGYKVEFAAARKNLNPAEFIGSAVNMLLTADISYSNASAVLADMDFMALVQQWRASFGLDKLVSFTAIKHTEEYINMYNLLVIDKFMQKVYRREGHQIVNDIIVELKRLNPATNVLNETDLSLKLSGTFLLYDACLEATKEMMSIALEMLVPYGQSEALVLPSMNIMANANLTSMTKNLIPGSLLMRTLVKFDRSFANRIDLISTDNALLSYSKYASLAYVAALNTNTTVDITDVDYMYNNASVDISKFKHKIMMLSADFKTLTTFNVYAEAKFDLESFMKTLKVIGSISDNTGVVPSSAVTVLPPMQAVQDQDPAMMLDENLMRLLFMYSAKEANENGYDSFFLDNSIVSIESFFSKSQLLNYLGLSLTGDISLVDDVIKQKNFTFPGVFFVFKPGALILTEYLCTPKYRLLTSSEEYLTGVKLLPSGIFEALDVVFI